MRKPWDCPKCGKCFTKEHAARQHIQDYHKGGAEPRRRPKPQRVEQEESLADISVKANLKRMMGEPLDPLEESLLSD